MRKINQKGFTLVETLAAILLISVAIVAPMALTVQSLESAFYARDQITASNLAQEGIEAVRSIRDANILLTARGNATPLFQGIPIGTPFIIDGTQIQPSNMVTNCSNTCGPLMTNGTLYGYQGSFTTTTNFVRTMTASTIWSDSNGAQEIQINSVVTWKTAAYQSRSITLTEDLYNWVIPGSGS